VAGGIQPETLRRTLGKARIEDGLAARVLFTMPPRSNSRWTEVEPDPDSTAALRLAFRRLLRMEPDPEGSPVLITLSAEAKAAWIDFYEQHRVRAADFTGALAAAWSKLRAYCARFALILDLLDRAAGLDDLRTVKPISAESMHAAIRLTRWFGCESERVYGMLEGTPRDDLRRRTLDWITAKGGEVSVRDLTRGPREFQRGKGANDYAERFLNSMVDDGLGKWFWPPPAPRGGPPKRTFRLVAMTGDDATTTRPDPESAIAINERGLRHLSSVSVGDDAGAIGTRPPPSLRNGVH
jgi:hypothetical protein